jgi:hypothetical protein
MQRVTIPPKKGGKIFPAKHDAYQKLISVFIATCDLEVRRES